ncbi:MAG: Spy/CpxP family protein refolding chaperone [Xanthomonadales bacterium]|nr:Spy/CpxP family protein refolding chaperone [Xanthomonadales bacterium]
MQYTNVHTKIHTTSHNYLSSYKNYLLFILLAILSSSALAKSFTPGGQSSDMHIQRIADRLDLNEQQREEFLTIMSAKKTANAPREIAMQANREALERLISSDNPDQAKIQSLAEAQGDLFTESFLQRAAIKQKIYAILTAEQRIKMQVYKDVRQNKRANRKNKREQHKSSQQRP